MCRRLVGAAARRALRLVHALLHGVQIGENEFEVDRFDIAHGVHGIFDVGHVRVLEAPHDVDDRVHLADMRKKFIAQALAAARALHEPRDIDEFDDGGGDFFAVVQGGELVEPFVGNGDYAYVGFYGAEGVIRGFRARVRDCVEQSGFSYVRKSHNTEFHVCYLQKFFLIIIAYFPEIFKSFVCLFA